MKLLLKQLGINLLAGVASGASELFGYAAGCAQIAVAELQWHGNRIAYQRCEARKELVRQDLKKRKDLN